MGIDLPRETVLVGMSGGVDSAVAALLLKNEGYKLKGSILRTHDAGMTPEDIANGKLPSNIWHAREAARKLRMDFTITDARAEFEEKVVRPYQESRERGIAQDPCILCNRQLKFPLLFHLAEKLECRKVASGHYARISYDPASGRQQLRKSEDKDMDQSFLLYPLSQDELSRLLTPLGNHTKKEIRQLAHDIRFKNAALPESRDVCFLPEGSFFRQTRTADSSGQEGRSRLRIGQVHYVSIPDLPEGETPVQVKLRYETDEFAAMARPMEDGSVMLRLKEPVPPALPGQSVVLYDGDLLLAGGILLSDEAFSPEQEL